MSDKDQSNPNNRNFAPSEAFVAHAHVQSHAEYRALYEKSLEEPEEFWREETSDLVWREPWKKFSEWKLDSQSVDAKFFIGGSAQSDRELSGSTLSYPRAREKAAIVFEGEPGDVRTLTYFQLHREVVKMTAALATLGVNKGDRVAILHGHGPRNRHRDARVRAPRRRAFGGVRRIFVGSAA